jgi:hypothetical protein
MNNLTIDPLKKLSFKKKEKRIFSFLHSKNSKSLVVFGILLFFTVLSFAQTTIWQENFDSYSDGTQNGAGTGISTATWSTNDGNIDVRTSSGSNKVLRGSQTNNTNSRWTTNNISISGYSNVQFSFDVDYGGSLDSGQDQFEVEYQITGNPWVIIENASGDTSPSEPIQPNYTVSGLTGNNIRFRITFYNTASDEYYSIDNFIVQDLTPNAPPVLTATGNLDYCVGSAGQNIATAVSISDPDDTTTNEIFIQISSGYVNGEDLLTLTGSHPGITATWTAVDGKLVLTGPATYAAFENAILDVVYSSSNPAASGSRSFSITVGSPNYLPSTGHYYEYVSDLGITWTAAKAAAASRTYFGLQGYLATLTSQEEADFSGLQAVGVGWIGASDDPSQGASQENWQWVTGPEAGQQFWTGLAGGSTTAPSNFAFWNTGEPNDSGGGSNSESYAHITAASVGISGSWNDLSNTGAASGSYQPQGYVVEYGGMAGDPVLQISATTQINISDYDFYECAIDVSSIINSCSADAAYTTVGATPDRNAGTVWNNSGPRYNRWFSFVATTPNIYIRVDIGGTKGTQRRSQLALWEADGTTEIASSRYVSNNDDITIIESGLTPGATYYISVDTFNASYAGSFTLCLTSNALLTCGKVYASAYSGGDRTALYELNGAVMTPIFNAPQNIGGLAISANGKAYYDNATFGTPPLYSSDGVTQVSTGATVNGLNVGETADPAGNVYYIDAAKHLRRVSVGTPGVATDLGALVFDAGDAIGPTINYGDMAFDGNGRLHWYYSV